MTQIVRLQRTEAVTLDHGVLEAIATEHGTVRGAEIVHDACFGIIEALTRFEVAIATGAGAEAKRLAGRVGRHAVEIGMTGLARAARAAEAGIASGDPVARAATAQRLLRTADAALSEMLDAI